MRFKNNRYFSPFGLVSILILFCLFSSQVFGQKTTRKRKSVVKQPTVEKQSTIPQPLNGWAEIRKSSSPRKLALLIGISDYISQCKTMPGKPCLSKLNGKNDVEELGKVLRSENFEFEVNELTDSQATIAGIRQAFEKLISLTKQGDIVYIHFSGHGGQVPDQPNPNGDEADGMDEAIVPFDYGYEGDPAGLIIDDQINKWLEALKEDNPSSVTVTFDSCFSGTAIRGGVSRGSNWSKSTAENIGDQISETSASGLVENSKSPNTGFVYISAASPIEIAGETEDFSMGLFTQALIKTLDRIKTKPNNTYGDVFESIKDVVTRQSDSQQNPQIEGDKDNLLFGNSVIPTERYYTIKTDGVRYILQAGKLHGMRVGSKFAVYEAGTKKVGAGRKLTDAEIIQTDPLVSVLRFAKPIKSLELIGARAFETARKLDVDAVRVAVDSRFPESKIIEETVKSYDLVQFVEQENEKTRNYDLIFRRRDEKIDKDLNAADGNIVMERSNGSVKVFSSTGDQLKKEIKDALEREVRWKTVKELENANSDLQLEMRIVPVNGLKLNSVGKRQSDDFGKPLEPTFGNNGLQLNLGDYARIEIKNNGNSPVYVTILGLSEGQVKANFPKTDEDIRDERNKIAGNGQWKPVSVFRVTPPLGIDAYKLIATQEQADFSSLIDPSVPQTGTRDQQIAKTLPIGQLFKVLSSGNRRGDPIAPAPPESWATTTISYQIKCPIVNGVKKCCVDRSQKPWVAVECKN